MSHGSYRSMWRPAGLAAAILSPLLAGSYASAETASPLLQCIESQFADGRLRTRHILEGTGDVISRNGWAISCEGAVALRLWDAVYPYRSGEPVIAVERDDTKGSTIAFGTNSRCYKPLPSLDATPEKPARCDIYLDVVNDLQMSGLLRGD